MSKSSHSLIALSFAFSCSENTVGAADFHRKSMEITMPAAAEDRRAPIKRQVHIRVSACAVRTGAVECDDSVALSSQLEHRPLNVRAPTPTCPNHAAP
jgi:hypothetical protein